MPIIDGDGNQYEDEFQYELSRTKNLSQVAETGETAQQPPDFKWVDAGNIENKPPVSLRDIAKSAGKDVVKAGKDIYNAITLGPKLMQKVYNGEIDPDSPEAIAAVNQVAMTFGMGGLVTAPMREGAGMFGGQLGALRVPGMRGVFTKAEKDLADGKDPMEVYRNHGVFEGPEGHLRFEIPDEAAKLNTNALTKVASHTEKEEPNSWTMAFTNTGEPLYGSKPGTTVGDVLDHPELFKHYPDLKDIPFVEYPLVEGEKMPLGAHWRKVPGQHDEMLFLAPQSKEAVLSTLLHELQHSVQVREGFASGGYPGQFLEQLPHYKVVQELHQDLAEQLAIEYEKTVSKTLGPYRHYKLSEIASTLAGRSAQVPVKVLNSIKKEHPDFYDSLKLYNEGAQLITQTEADAVRKYRQLFGEFEARATQERKDYTPIDRRVIPPWEGPEYKATYPDEVIPDEAIIPQARQK